jgi:large conductance mechanosensitive channel
MTMWADFKKFLTRGNVLDLAIAVIIGAALTTVVNSLVNDIIMPPIGMLLGGVNFNDLFIVLDGGSYTSLAAAKAAGGATINYGVFINTIITFVIVAFVAFLIVRWASKLIVKPAPVAAPATKDCPYCYTAIPVKATRCPNCTSELH